MIMMCPGSFILNEKCTTLVNDVDNDGGYAYVGAGGKSLSLLPNFIVNLKLP